MARTLKAMLMCAGLGTRMRPYTDATPKVLLPILGVPCAQWAIDAIVDAGVDDIVANVHHLANKTTAELHRLDLAGAHLTISDESSRLLGSAGGLKHAERSLGSGAFLYVNGDVLCAQNLRALALRHERLRSKWGVQVTLGVIPRAPLGGAYRELILDRAGDRLIGLGAHREGAPLFTGSAVIESEVLEGLPVNEPSELVPMILEPAIQSGRAGVYLESAAWHDIGNPSLWHRAHLDLIDAMETGALLRRWRARIEQSNRREADRIWVHQSAEPWVDVSGWRSPAYWSPGQGRAPRSLGPRAVLYGDLESDGRDTAHTLIYGGHRTEASL